jgi:hypothetical protein
MCFYVLLFSAFNGREIHIGGVLMEGRFILGGFNGREIHIRFFFCINNFRLYAD